MDKLYRLEELTTEGWTLMDNKARKLTKEQCDDMIEGMLKAGVNPNRLRAVADVGEGYQTPF